MARLLVIPTFLRLTKLVSSPMAVVGGYETSGRSYTSTACESEGEDPLKKLMNFINLEDPFYFWWMKYV